MTCGIDLSVLRPRSLGGRVLHSLLLGLAVTGCAASLGAIIWLLIGGLQLALTP